MKRKRRGANDGKKTPRPRQAGPSALHRQRRSQGHCRAPMLLRRRASKLPVGGKFLRSSLEGLAADRLQRSRALCGLHRTGAAPTRRCAWRSLSVAASSTTFCFSDCLLPSFKLPSACFYTSLSDAKVKLGKPAVIWCWWTFLLLLRGLPFQPRLTRLMVRLYCTIAVYF